jgi:hypothetical protein
MAHAAGESGTRDGAVEVQRNHLSIHVLVKDQYIAC